MSELASSPQDDLDDEGLEKVHGMLLRMLLASPFAPSSRWGKAAIVMTPERREVVHRLALAGLLREGGLDREAHQAAVQVVPRGSVLCWLVEDTEERAFAALIVCPIMGGPRR